MNSKVLLRKRSDQTVLHGGREELLILSISQGSLGEAAQ